MHSVPPIHWWNGDPMIHQPLLTLGDRVSTQKTLGVRLVNCPKKRLGKIHHFIAGKINHFDWVIFE